MSTYLLTDQQTRDDLGISPRQWGTGEYSLPSLYLHAETKGGKDLLAQWIEAPLADPAEIERRQEAVACGCLPDLPLDGDEADFLEYYLDFRDDLSYPRPLLSLAKAADRLLFHNNRRYIVTRGIRLALALASRLYRLGRTGTDMLPALLRERLDDVCSSVEGTELEAALAYAGKKRIPCLAADRLDYLFRHTRLATLRRLLQTAYLVDALRTARRVADERHFCRPRLTDDGSFALTGFTHPFVPGCRENDWQMGRGNLCIFTGSNMAGKSTTLKSIALAVWLAHCGLPVPARAMNCPVFGSLHTSINLPDSLRGGRSHFMAEVERIRDMLLAARDGRRSLVVLDEMFRGTNAQDAYEASVSVTARFKALPRCHALVSTHILEYARRFEHDPACSFYSMEARIEDDCFVCPHRLLPGISEARFGHWLAEKALRDVPGPAAPPAGEGR